jgi:hypothetical protein
MTNQKPKCAKFRIDNSDPCYPRIMRNKGFDPANGVTTFHTLGEAKKALLFSLTTQKEHYQGLIDDVRKVTIEVIDKLSYPDILD